MTAHRKTIQNIGRLHSVTCEWCMLKMACSCMFDDLRDDPRNPHPRVICPKCQVTDFLNLLFGKKRNSGGKPATAVVAEFRQTAAATAGCSSAAEKGSDKA